MNNPAADLVDKFAQSACLVQPSKETSLSRELCLLSLNHMGATRHVSLCALDYQLYVRRVPVSGLQRHQHLMEGPFWRARLAQTSPVSQSAF